MSLPQKTAEILRGALQVPGRPYLTFSCRHQHVQTGIGTVIGNFQDHLDVEHRSQQ